jgi:hypothetical protein
LAISLAWMGGWAVMEPRRAALERLAAGERLVEDDQDLPQVRGLVHPPRAACVAQHPELRIQALWPGAEPASCAGRTSVVVPASVFASDLIGHRWGAPSVWLELFVRTGGRSVTAGPLQLTDRAVVDVQSVAENLPSRFDPEQGFAAQLDAWLRDQLGEREETELVSGNVWVVDTPRGSMMLLPGAGVTVSDPATRRETLGELLDAVERPRLVQVAGSAWTIQDALDLCMEVQTLDAREVPCVWVRR